MTAPAPARSLKPGMKVVIVSTPQSSVASNHGLVRWRNTMNEYCGKTAGIISLRQQGEPAVTLDIDAGKHWWSVSWVAPVNRN